MSKVKELETFYPNIDRGSFYNNYHGHNIRDLTIIYRTIRDLYPDKKFVYLVGDSTFDNKYWINDNKWEAINGYEKVLNNPFMKGDVCYNLNKILAVDKNYFCLNCAVEESTLDDRKSKLLAQDKFVRKYIRSNDILIVSIGGNDIVLKPKFQTIINLISLIYLNSNNKIMDDPRKVKGMMYFINLFKNEVKNILKILFQ